MQVWFRGVVVAGVVALAGCGQQPQQAAPDIKTPLRYVYVITDDISGHYAPDREVHHLNWRLKSINLGEPADFAQWQAGQRDVAKAPVVFVFEDTDKGPDALNASGQPRRFSVVAAAYNLEGAKIGLTAVSGGVGEIAFTGSLDGKVLNGTLKVGPETFENLVLK